MKRVLLLNNVPAPYFDPLFEILGRESGWQLTVCYTSAWNRDVGWAETGLDQSRSHGTIVLDQRFPGLRKYLSSQLAGAFALLEALIRQRPDYVICYGYTLKPQMVLLCWAMLTRTYFAVIGDANIHSDLAHGLKRLVKNLWLGVVTRRAAALITIGTANRRFWESYGARPGRLFEARFAVDNDYFAGAIAERKEDVTARRSQLGLSGKVVFLFVGRLVKRKNVDLIIAAARQLNDQRLAVVIAGAGEEREALEAEAAGDPRIIFAGGVAPSELPLYYAISDVLVLPAAQEPWGLVINEAMACGLAIIAHRHCGATIDLVDDQNGVILESFSIAEMVEALRLLADNDEMRRRMQERSRLRIQGWSIPSAARGIIEAVETSSLPGNEENRHD